MPENKTQPTKASVTAFLDSVENDTRRTDARALAAMMQRVSGVKPQMWGPSIVGYGTKNYRYDSGREGDMPRIGFSPRKANLALYMLAGEQNAELLTRLGMHKRGAGCLYISKLADVDLTILEQMAKQAWQNSAQDT